MADPNPTPLTKVCFQCHLEKPREAFWPTRKNGKYLNSRCKACCVEHCKAWRHAQRDKVAGGDADDATRQRYEAARLRHNEQLRLRYASSPAVQKRVRETGRKWKQLNHEWVLEYRRRRRASGIVRRQEAAIRAANREKLAAQRMARLAKPHIRLVQLVACARVRSRQLGIAFSPELRQVLSAVPPTHCPCCGHALDYSTDRKGKNRTWSPSLDRVDSSKGYVVGNVAVICLRCNMRKNDSTVEDLEMILRYMRAQLSASHPAVL
jgi:hypothetical protein